MYSFKWLNETFHCLHFWISKLNPKVSRRWGVSMRCSLSVSSHHFLLIHYGSEVTEAPDQLEGNVATGTFTAGYYQATGKAIPSTGEPPPLSKVVYGRPRRPFGVSVSQWSKAFSLTRGWIQGGAQEPPTLAPNFVLLIMGKSRTGLKTRINNKMSSFLPS